MKVPCWLVLLVALALLAGCAPAYLKVGPNPARVEVVLQAVAPSRHARYGDLSRQIYWDWGLYLMGRDGSLQALAPASGERLKVISANPLKRTTTFLAPAGDLRLRLIAEAYINVPSSQGYDNLGIASFQRDFSLRVGPGQKKTIKVELK